MYFVDMAVDVLRTSNDQEERGMALISIRSAIYRRVPGIEQVIMDLSKEDVLTDNDVYLLTQAIIVRDEKMS